MLCHVTRGLPRVQHAMLIPFEALDTKRSEGWHVTHT